MKIIEGKLWQKLLYVLEESVIKKQEVRNLELRETNETTDDEWERIEHELGREKIEMSVYKWGRKRYL